jgi:hypothetical protein
LETRRFLSGLALLYRYRMAWHVDHAARFSSLHSDRSI